METTPHTHHEPDNGDRDFDGYLARISARFALIDASTPLFRVTVEGLFDEYIDRLANRQYHNCNACRQFFKNYATLVTVNEDGSLRSAIWDHVDSIPPYYVDAIAYVKKRVENATIESVFMSDQNVYGVVSNLAPDGKRWTHYAVKPHKSRKHTRRDITADQAIAAKTQDFETVSRALGSWKRGTMTQLAALLASGAIKSSVEKVEGNAKWLLDLANRIKEQRSSKHRNLIWLAVATAPAGFCHPRASLLGSLLDDLEAGKTAEQINNAYAAKTHGLAYQRPKAAPSDGAIAQAEKLFETMGLARALERRPARLDEIVALWKPPASKEQAGGGIFDSLKSKKSVPDPVVSTDVQRITRVKFERDILPSAERIQALLPYSGHFMAFVTAVHADAPPLLKWDSEETRNAVSWYLYNGGSEARQWGLRAGMCNVIAITKLPCHWVRQTPNEDDRRVLILEGCKDTLNTSLALFPECVRGELHGVRSVIEAHSKRSKLAEIAGPVAAGIDMKGVILSVHLAGGVIANYQIDRDE